MVKIDIKQGRNEKNIKKNINNANKIKQNSRKPLLYKA